MKIYNVRVAVVALVAADSPERAIERFLVELRQKGFEPLDDGPNQPDAFAAEDQTVKSDF